MARASPNAIPSVRIAVWIFLTANTYLSRMPLKLVFGVPRELLSANPALSKYANSNSLAPSENGFDHRCAGTHHRIKQNLAGSHIHCVEYALDHLWVELATIGKKTVRRVAGPKNVLFKEPSATHRRVFRQVKRFAKADSIMKSVPAANALEVCSPSD